MIWAFGHFLSFLYDAGATDALSFIYSYVKYFAGLRNYRHDRRIPTIENRRHLYVGMCGCMGLIYQFNNVVTTISSRTHHCRWRDRHRRRRRRRRTSCAPGSARSHSRLSRTHRISSGCRRHPNGETVAPAIRPLSYLATCEAIRCGWWRCWLVR